MPSQQMPSPLKTEISLSSLRGIKLKRPATTPSFLTGNLSFKRKRTVAVGVDIQPGYIAAARARKNGGIVVEEASAVSLPADTVREGEVLNEEALAGALRELFANVDLDKHVRIGVANQRTVMRTLEVPPLSDSKELAAAVRFQAEDQVPMPLNNAVIDFRPLGIVDTPEGARQRVLLVAAQRDMIDKLLSTVKAAGLHPESIDLSAFALIRSLYRTDMVSVADGASASGELPRVIHLNVGGLTNMAIAQGTDCRFTRVLGRGLEAIAGEVAERRAVPIDQARELLRRVNLSTLGSAHSLANLGSHDSQASATEALAVQMEAARAETEAVVAAGPPPEDTPAGPPAVEEPTMPPAGEAIPPEGEAARPTLTVVGGTDGELPPPETAMQPVEPAPADPGAVQVGFEQPSADPAAGSIQDGQTEVGLVGGAGGIQEAPAGGEPVVGGHIASAASDASETSFESAQPPVERVQSNAPVPAAPAEDLGDVTLVLEAGVRGIAGEVRNSLDYYHAQEPGSAVALILLSGPALDIPGFGEMLEQNLGVPVHGETVSAAGATVLHGISPQYLAIAAGLAVEEI